MSHPSSPCPPHPKGFGECSFKADSGTWALAQRPGNSFCQPQVFVPRLEPQYYLYTHPAAMLPGLSVAIDLLVNSVNPAT